jgi:Mn2+/Fe2+ NRAMP family transporter
MSKLEVFGEDRIKNALGSGIISGASDNDPTTVASLAVIGSTTVYALNWLVVLIIPMLAVVQAISAQIGAVTKCGLERIIRRHYGFGWALVAMLSIVIVNILTLGADLEGGGAALQLLTGISYRVWVVPIAVAITSILIFGSYKRIERLLIFIPLIFLSYVAAAVAVHPDWRQVLLHTFIPHLEATPEYISGAIALLGTTLTSYVYVWESIEVAHNAPVRRIGLVQAEGTLGAVVAGVTFFFIVVATGATLGTHHHVVETAQDAAEALQPIAGRWSALLFGVGLLGSALLAIPVLTATSAYVISAMFHWRGDLDSKFWRAKLFYITMGASMLAGLAIAFAGVAPVKLLFVSSIVGGLATPITLLLMMVVAQNRTIMRHGLCKGWLLASGWCVTAIVTVAAMAYLYQTAFIR